WITRSESREDHGGLVRNDLGTGNHVGSGQSGRILLDHVVSATSLTLRQDRPGRVGLDAVRNERRNAHTVEHALADLPPVILDGQRHRCLDRWLRSGRDRIESLVQRRSVLELKNIIDVGLIDPIAYSLQIEKKGITSANPQRISNGPPRVRQDQALADRIGSKEEIRGRDLDQGETMPCQLAKRQQSDEISRPGSAFPRGEQAAY